MTIHALRYGFPAKAPENHHAVEIQTFGFWIYLISDLILFAALFANFGVIGQNYAGGSTGKDLFDLPHVFGETMLLLFSSATYGMAMLAMQANRKGMVLLWLGITFMEDFIPTDYLDPAALEAITPYSEPVLLWPYGVHGNPQELADETHLPPGEVLIRRGSRVIATDGKIGKVDEFLINPLNDRISHIIMREGHLWGHKDVTIPVSQIERIADGVVHLKLDKHAVATLPGTPIKRKWK